MLIAFQDNGCGIPEDIREQLFHRQVTTKTDGIGLGLVNVRQIIQDFGGTVNLESQEGKGATVTLRLQLEND